MWNLMNEAISLPDKEHMCDFIMHADRFTSGRKVREFERSWCDWQGCKHSVFVNSGSSANLILIAAVKHIYGLGGAVAQAVTWSTNVAPLMQLGYDLQLCDVSLENLGPDINSLSNVLESGAYKIMFLSHILGLNALSEELIDLLNKHNVILLEDCCESTGAMFGDRKVGTFGLASTFSFYFGHHMTTVEGGMVCTDDDDLYNILRMMRSHGLSREGVDIPPMEGVDPSFTFVVPGFNTRNTEIYAALGVRKLRELDGAILHRNNNLFTFTDCIDGTKFVNTFNRKGASSFALPLICFEGSQRVKHCLDDLGIEHRPIVSGSLYRHPFMQMIHQEKHDTSAELIHSCGVYVGNHEGVSEDMIIHMCEKLGKSIR